jgi:hypothetical protein
MEVVSETKSCPSSRLVSPARPPRRSEPGRMSLGRARGWGEPCSTAGGHADQAPWVRPDVMSRCGAAWPAPKRRLGIRSGAQSRGEDGGRVEEAGGRCMLEEGTPAPSVSMLIGRKLSTSARWKGGRCRARGCWRGGRLWAQGCWRGDRHRSRGCWMGDRRRAREGVGKETGAECEGAERRWREAAAGERSHDMAMRTGRRVGNDRRRRDYGRLGSRGKYRRPRCRYVGTPLRTIERSVTISASDGHKTSARTDKEHPSTF